MDIVKLSIIGIKIILIIIAFGILIIILSNEITIYLNLMLTVFTTELTVKSIGGIMLFGGAGLFIAIIILFIIILVLFND